MRDNKTLLKAGTAAQLEKLTLPENTIKEDFDFHSIFTLYNLLSGEEWELFDELYHLDDTSHPVELDVIDYAKIRHEAADIANFAHMIIYKCDQELGK